VATVAQIYETRAAGSALAAEDSPRADLPGLKDATMQDYAVQGAKALQPLLDGMTHWIDQQSSG